MEPSCWCGKIPPGLNSDEGVPLLERMNGLRLVQHATGDLPLLFLVNGRHNDPIPWQNNPPFYRALNDAGQGFLVYWDNGDHSTCGKDAPADVRAWLQHFRRYRLDESFPAFSNTSSNRNPGDGRPDDGDVIGWMNRGMDSRQIIDTPTQYAITLLADYPGIKYPVRTDVTLRPVQRFKTAPGQRLLVRVGDAGPRGSGRPGWPSRVKGVVIPGHEGVRVTVERHKSGRFGVELQAVRSIWAPADCVLGDRGAVGFSAGETARGPPHGRRPTEVATEHDAAHQH